MISLRMRTSKDNRTFSTKFLKNKRCRKKKLPNAEMMKSPMKILTKLAKKNWGC